MTYSEDNNRTIENIFSASVSNKAMKMAIISACFGVVSQYVVRESSIIILYANKLGGSNFLTLLTTAMQPLSVALLIIPIAYIMEHTGKRALMVPALVVSVFGGSIIAAAGFFPETARVLLVFGLVIYSLSVSIFVAGWFPLLQGIVPKQKRPVFFRNMRVSWQSFLSVFLLLSAVFVGRDAPLGILQLIILFSALLMIGRILAIRKIPEIPKQKYILSLKNSVGTTLRNRSLVRFSIYMFFLYLFSHATLPVSMMFTKLELHAPDNYTVFLSTMITVGQISGYFVGGNILKRWSPKKLLLSANALFMLLNLLFLTVHRFNLFSAMWLSIIVMLYGGCFAYSTIGLSSEMLSLAQPEALNMSMAICVAFYVSGQGLSRIISGYLIDSGLIPEQWFLFGIQMSSYHGLFICYGVCLLLCFILITYIPKGRAEKAMFPQY